MNMHYLTFVFIPKDADVEEGVAEALRPFSGDFPVKPWKCYLDAEEIAQMAKHYGVRKTSVQKLTGCMENWNGGTGGVDKKGLFAIHTYNPDARWDWYEIGSRPRVLPGNAMIARSLHRSRRLNDFLPHDFL